MKEKSWKIIIGVLIVVIVVLIAMILLKGKNLNPFAKEGEGEMKVTGEGGIYQEFVSVPTEGSSSFNLENGGEGAQIEGGMFKQEIGE